MQPLLTGGLRSAAFAVVLAWPFAGAIGATLEPVSRTAEALPNDAGNARSAATARAISGDGCRRVFSSGATNLVPDQFDINGNEDVFLHDCASGSLTLLSRRFDSAAVTADGASSEPVISPDGRYVAFSSTAGDLIDGLQRNHSGFDLYLYDTLDQTLQLVNQSPFDPLVTTEFGAGAPVFSGDSSSLVFGSSATDVLADIDDSNNGPDLFLYNLATSAKTLITRRANGFGFCIFSACTANAGSGQAGVSFDGRFVVYASGASNLVVGQNDSPGTGDVFVWDRDSGSSVLVSHAPGMPVQAVGQRSENPVISADGGFVAYTSQAPAVVLVQDDQNGDSDVFLWQRATGVNTLVSHLPGAATSTDPDGFSGNPSINPDGSLVAFTSVSQILVAGQVDPSSLSHDLFLFARSSGENTLISHAAGSPLTTAAGSATGSAFSADGSVLMFVSRASNLVAGQVDGNAHGDSLLGEDVFLHSLGTATTRLLSHVPGVDSQAGNFMSFTASVDADGSHVVFVSDANDLTLGPDNNDERDVLLWAAAGDDATVLSRRDPASDPVGMIGATEAVVSADGRFVAFTSEARNVYPGLVDDDTDNTSIDRDDDVFLLDRETGEYLLVSRSAAGADITGDDDANSPSISGDGRYVVFANASTEVIAGQIDGNDAFDVFLFDRLDRSVRLLSRSAGNPLQTGNGASGSAQISRNGGHVVFTSTASNLVAGGSDANAANDVFLYDIAADSLRLVSRTSSSATTAGNGDSRRPVVSADGRHVAYETDANNIVGAFEFNGSSDVLLFDRDAAGNPNRFVSRTAASAGTPAAGASRLPRISADGRFVAFLSNADNLLPGFFSAGNTGFDAYLFDRDAGFAPTVLVSRQPGEDSLSGDGPVSELSISDDGSRIAFISTATNLSTGQNDQPFSDDLFLFDSSGVTVRLVSESAFAPGVAVGAERARIAGDGSTVLFDSRSWEIAEGLLDAGSESKTWLHLVDAGASVLIARSVLGPGYPPRSYSQLADITPDGSVSLFLSPSADIVSFDGNRAYPGQFGQDAFAFERALGIPVVEGLPDLAVDEDQSTGPLPFIISDPDGDASDLLASGRSSNQILVPNANIMVGGGGSERWVEILPAAEQSGTTTITLRAVDADGNIGTTSFELTVNLVNDAPQLVLPGPVEMLEDSNSGLLDFTVDDPDHPVDEVLLTVSSSDTAVVPNSGIALAGSGGQRRIRITPAADRFGPVQIELRAEDPDGAVRSEILEVMVLNVNDAPSFTGGGDVQVDEDTYSAITGWGSAISAGPFEVAQQLAFEVVGNSNPDLFEGGPLIGADGTLSFVPAANQSGVAVITIRLRDDGGVANGGEDTSPPFGFSITVAAVNDPPELTGAAILTLDEDGSAVYDFGVDDVEDGPLALQLAVSSSDGTLLPVSGLVLGGSGSARTLQVMPAADAWGTAFVEIIATDDDGAEGSLVFQVTVEAVDEQVDLIADLDNGVDFIDIGSEVTWTATVVNAGVDTAYAAQLLDSAPQGMTDISWQCVGSGGGSCAVAVGNGPVATGLHLPSGAQVELSIRAVVTAEAVPLLSYGVEAAIGPDSIDDNPEDNLAVDIDAVGQRLFGDGFED